MKKNNPKLNSRINARLIIIFFILLIIVMVKYNVEFVFTILDDIFHISDNTGPAPPQH